MDLFEACCCSRELWDEVQLAAQHGLLVIDLQGQILCTSQSLAAMLGYEHGELQGASFALLLTSEDLGYFYPNLLYMAHKERPFEGELMLRRKDESRFIAHVKARPCYDPRQARHIVVISVQDIDRLKQLEKMPAQVHFEDLIRVANGVAHEIRNPLVGIGGFVHRLFKHCVPSAELQVYHDHIMKNLQKIDNIIKKVELFAHLPKPVFETVDIRALLQEAVDPFREILATRGIALELAVEEAQLRVDRGMVVRALSILLQNALDAMGERGILGINSRVHNGDCQVSVADTGSGIAAEDLPFVFNPFFSTKADGVGLDLAVVKRIMDTHRGRVEVRSNKGEGATFILSFPLERRRLIRCSLLAELGDIQEHNSLADPRRSKGLPESVD